MPPQDIVISVAQDPHGRCYLQSVIWDDVVLLHIKYTLNIISAKHFNSMKSAEDYLDAHQYLLPIHARILRIIHD